MMSKQDLSGLLKVAEFTNLFSVIYRKTITNKDGSLENNSQHSFQLALVAWYICSKNKLDLDLDKIIKYALVHDLVETYSGNFPAYSRNRAVQNTKQSAESEALKKIQKDLRDFPELMDIINEYNLQVNNESKFIYALDKLIPIINIELNNNDFYFKTKTTYEDMRKVKAEKIAKDPIVNEYFELLQNYLKNERNFFWPDCKNRDYSKKEYYT